MHIALSALAEVFLKTGLLTIFINSLSTLSFLKYAELSPNFIIPNLLIKNRTIYKGNILKNIFICMILNFSKIELSSDSFFLISRGSGRGDAITDNISFFK